MNSSKLKRTGEGILIAILFLSIATIVGISYEPHLDRADGLQFTNQFKKRYYKHYVNAIKALRQDDLASTYFNLSAIARIDPRFNNTIKAWHIPVYTFGCGQRDGTSLVLQSKGGK